MEESVACTNGLQVLRMPLSRISIWQGIKVLWWLATRGLFRRGARFTTVVSVVTVLLLTGITVAAMGLFYGHFAIQRQRIIDDPLTLCLWVGDPRSAEASITAANLERLKEILSDREDVRGWYPFSEVYLDWFFLPDDLRHASIAILGRTLNKDDPLLKSCRFIHGGPSQDGGELSVVVTERFLQFLKHSPHHPYPSSVRVRTAAGTEAHFRVVGVLAHELPFGYEFLMPEECYCKIVQPPHKSSWVRTGPLPADWPREREQLPGEVRTAFAQYGLFLPRIQSLPAPSWLLTTSDFQPISISAWMTYLGRIAEIMEASGYSKPTSAFFELQYETPATQDETGQGWDLACLYVKSVEALRSVKQALEEQGLVVQDTENTISRLEKLHQSAKATGTLLAGLLVVLGVGLLLTLAGLQATRIETKLKEIGMLKAVGMSDGFTTALFAMESTIIWACGTVCGLLLAWALGKRFLGPTLIEFGDQYREIAFILPWSLLGITLATIFLFCVGTSVLAARKAIRLSPLQTLHGK